MSYISLTQQQVRVNYLRRLDDITPCCWVYLIVVTSQNDVIANSRTNVDDIETISVSLAQLPTATLERRPRTSTDVLTSG